MKLIKSMYSFSSWVGIIALENSRNNRVLLIRTSDALGTLSRVLRSVKSRNKRWSLLRKDIKKINIKLVSTDNSRISFQYWVSHYESKGYTLYSKYNAIEYKVKIEVDVGNGRDYTFVVNLVSRNRTRFPVGWFNTLEEAESFVLSNYKDESITKITYAENERSRERLSKR